MTYEIVGGNLPAVICQVNAGEKMRTESGAMGWMSSNMVMQTDTGGGVGKMFGRMFAGEHAFQNTYEAQGGPGMIAFSSSFPGEIRAIEVGPGKEFVIQKSAYLASEEGVELSTFFQKKLGAGLFGGEGFVMSKLSGQGTAFVEITGAVVEYELQAGEQLTLATGFLAAMSATCDIDVVTLKGVKNVLFGGESLFNTIITGPGKVLVQTMPIVRVANALLPYLPQRDSNSGGVTIGGNN